MTNAWDPTIIAARLERVVASGKLEGVELDFWNAWGPAPPARRSVQLRLLEVNGEDTLEVARTKRSNEAPSPLDRYRMPASPEMVASFARHLLEVMTSAESEGVRSHDPDVTNVSVIEGGRSATRTWNRYDVPDLAALRAEVGRLSVLAAEQGTHDVVRFNQPVTPIA